MVNFLKVQVPPVQLPASYAVYVISQNMLLIAQLEAAFPVEGHMRSHSGAMQNLQVQLEFGMCSMFCDTNCARFGKNLEKRACLGQMGLGLQLPQQDQQP